MAELQGDRITNSAGTGAPDFPNGFSSSQNVPVPSGQIASSQYYLATPIQAFTTPGGWQDFATSTALVKGVYFVYLNAVLYKATATLVDATSYLGISTYSGNDATGLVEGRTSIYNNIDQVNQIFYYNEHNFFAVVVCDGINCTVNGQAMTGNVLYLKSQIVDFTGSPVLNAGFMSVTKIG